MSFVGVSATVVRYLALMLGDPDEAQDVSSEAFRQALEAWRNGRGPAGRPLPWLLTIARRLVINRWRRRRLIRWIPIPSGRLEPRSIGSPNDEAEFWLWLEALAKALPDRQRE